MTCCRHLSAGSWRSVLRWLMTGLLNYRILYFWQSVIIMCSCWFPVTFRSPWLGAMAAPMLVQRSLLGSIMATLTSFHGRVTLSWCTIPSGVRVRQPVSQMWISTWPWWWRCRKTSSAGRRMVHLCSLTLDHYFFYFSCCEPYWKHSKTQSNKQARIYNKSVVPARFYLKKHENQIDVHNK